MRHSGCRRDLSVYRPHSFRENQVKYSATATPIAVCNTTSQVYWQLYTNGLVGETSAGTALLPSVLGVTAPYLPFMPPPFFTHHPPDGNWMLEDIRSIVLHGLPGDEKTDFDNSKGESGVRRRGE